MKVKINGTFYEFFSEVTLSQSLDKVASTFIIKGRFNPDNETHQKIFKPLQYNLVQIYGDDDRMLFTGYVVNNVFTDKKTSELIPLSGYSKPGILEDVNIPVSNHPLEKNNLSLRDIATQVLKPFGIHPLEKNNLSLRDIATQVLKPFGISFIVSNSIPSGDTPSTPTRGQLTDGSLLGDMDIPYETTVAGVSETVKSYLSKLASQRNIILSHDVYGRLVFFRLNTKSNPKFHFDETNTLSMTLQIKGQGMHSDISVIRQPSFGNNDLTPEDSVENPLIGRFKPSVSVLSSGNDTDTKNASNNVLASELKNISLVIDFDKHIKLSLGDVVSVQNKKLYIYKKSRMVISSIVYSKNTKGDKTLVNLSLPESFTGQVPKNIFAL